MRGYFGLGQLSAAEKSDILNQHKSVYNGYQTMQPQVPNTQPLTVYDFAGDKEGLVVNNKGEVKKYTNMGINESVEMNEVCDDCGAMIMDGMCECNYGHMEEEMTEGDGETCECGGTIYEGMCNECGSGYMEEEVCEQCTMEEETGHLDDIYDEEDLNPTAGFDYIEGSSNDVDTFEGMHKKLYKEDDSDFQNYESSYTEDGVEDPNNEDDGFEDLNVSEDVDGELDELDIANLVRGKKYRYNHPLHPDDIEYGDEHHYESGNPMYSFKKGDTGYLMGSRDIEDYLEDLDDENVYEVELDEYDADDMDVSDVKPAYDFESDGPGDVYPVNEDDMYGYDPEKMYEFDDMESAWADEELEEQPDISGVQGIYGDMDPAFDFDSDGPGKAGPYQEFSYESELDEEEEFKEVDEDLKESFLTQKNKIMEMFNRFNKYN